MSDIVPAVQDVWELKKSCSESPAPLRQIQWLISGIPDSERRTLAALSKRDWEHRTHVSQSKNMLILFPCFWARVGRATEFFQEIWHRENYSRSWVPPNKRPLHNEGWRSPRVLRPRERAPDLPEIRVHQTMGPSQPPRLQNVFQIE